MNVMLQPPPKHRMLTDKSIEGTTSLKLMYD